MRFRLSSIGIRTGMTPIDGIAFLRRYLVATRHRCNFLDAPLPETLRSFAARAYPDIPLECVFIPVRSDSRRCEFRSFGSVLGVVIDLALSDRLMELDLLAQVARPQGDWIFTFSTAMLGDVFRQQRDIRRYRYCVLKASGDLRTLHTLAAIPKESAPVQAGIVPVLLHELAHIVYRRGDAFVETFKGLAEVALEKFAFASAEQAATGKYPVPEGQILGVPFEEYDQPRLKSQLEAYAATIRGNPELLEEVTCDIISALAFVNFEGRTDCFRSLIPEEMSLSPRQLGDVYYLAIKTSRYLQFLQGIQQFGINIASGQDALSRSMIEMTARTNALTFILTNLFDIQIEKTVLTEKPDFGKPVTAEETKSLMSRSIARLMQLQHQLLLEPFDRLTEFFLDPDAFQRDEESVLSCASDSVPESFDDVDRIRAALPL
jgi:hypothetical protein